MVLHRSSKLAIRAACYLAQQAPGKLTPVHEIAAQAGVSEAYLAKIFQRLVGAGLVRAFRGPGRGMELGRAPEMITLSSLVRAAQGSLDPAQCVLGLGACSEKNPCPLHSDWLPLWTGMQNLLEKTTLADLVSSLNRRSAEESAPEPARILCRNSGAGDGDSERGRSN